VVTLLFLGGGTVVGKIYVLPLQTQREFFMEKKECIFDLSEVEDQGHAPI